MAEVSSAAGSLTGFKFGSRLSKPPEVIVDFQLRYFLPFSVLLSIDVPVRFCGNCPFESVRYGVYRPMQICPVHRGLTRHTALDHLRRWETEHVMRTDGGCPKPSRVPLYKKSIMCSEPTAPEMPPPPRCHENQISRTEILR